MIMATKIMSIELRDASIRIAAKKLADRVYAIPVPEAEYCGFVCRIYDRKEHAVFGADGVYFEYDPRYTKDMTLCPDCLMSTFRRVWQEEKCTEETRDISNSFLHYFSTFERIVIRNAAMLLIECREMGWDHKGAEF